MSAGNAWRFGLAAPSRDAMSEKPWRFLHSNEQLSDRDVAGGAREADSCELRKACLRRRTMKRRWCSKNCKRALL